MGLFTRKPEPEDPLETQQKLEKKVRQAETRAQADRLYARVCAHKAASDAIARKAAPQEIKRLKQRLRELEG